MVAAHHTRSPREWKGRKGLSRLIVEAMMVTPVLAMFASALPALSGPSRLASTRSYVLPYDPVMNARYDAYIPLMRAFGIGTKDITEATARKNAPLWWAAAQSGRLLPLPPTSFRESMVEGATGQIMRATQQMDYVLRTTAEYRADRGDISGATKNLILGLEVSSVLKYSDPTTLSFSDAAYRRNLRMLADLAPKMSRKDKDEVAKTISILRPQTSMLADVLECTYNLYLEDGRFHQLPASVFPPIEELKKSVRPERLTAQLQGVDADFIRRTSNVSDVRYIGIARRAIQNEWFTSIEFDRAERALRATEQTTA